MNGDESAGPVQLDPISAAVGGQEAGAGDVVLTPLQGTDELKEASESEDADDVDGADGMDGASALDDAGGDATGG